MKKIFNKFKKASKKEVPPERITNETVAAHREKILAGGRKFKYPIQYARHKLVINTILISAGALIIALLFVWWQLYIVQSTNTILYRLTTVVPVPVASIDDYNVKFQDYLLKYRSTIHYKQKYDQVNFTTEEGRRQGDYDKIESMNEALMDAYAEKLARELNISVSDEEVSARMSRHREYRDGTISEDAYRSIIYDYYGWTQADYMHDIRRGLLREKVLFAVDEDARSRANQVIERLKTTDSSMQDIAKVVAGDDMTVIQYGSESQVGIGQDEGQAAVAMTLDTGEVSKPIESHAGDAYFVIRTTGKSESTVSYEYVRITLREFASRFDEAKKSSAKYYIAMPSVEDK